MDIRRALMVPVVVLGLGIAAFVAWPHGNAPDAATVPVATAEAPLGSAPPASTTPSRPTLVQPSAPIAPAAQNLRAIAWQADFEAAIAQSRATGKPVMVDFYTTWCEWCKKLDADVYTNQGVINESANFIAVKVDAERRADIASQYRVQGYPDIIWIRADGSVIDRLDGYADAPAFTQMMRSANSNAATSST